MAGLFEAALAINMILVWKGVYKDLGFGVQSLGHMDPRQFRQQEPLA